MFWYYFILWKGKAPPANTDFPDPIALFIILADEIRNGFYSRNLFISLRLIPVNYK